MWEMLDPDLECGNECGGPGPPPEFLVPPPPRPPFLAELVNCNEEQLLLQQTTAPFGGGAGGAAGSFAEVDMCEAFPIIDASYHSGPSFQTSAMIVLCSGLLLLVIFISSLLVWKHKRKVQNFLPCKTPTRGPPHLDATGVPAGHAVTYEDPDVHLGHHPLVMRHHHHHHHHHNMELHAKQIHYPSGYPMPRSPPLFICSSPGPDPYRSHDNVYEELEHGPGRDTDSEPPIQSDDDFAEDELSLPGDRSFHKSPSDGGTTVATIYHDRSNGGGSSNSAVTTASASTMPVTDGGGGCCAAGVEGSVGGPPAPATVAASGPSSAYLERNRTERNSLLSSSSSSGNDNTHPLAHPHHHHHRGGTAAVPPSLSAGGLNGAGNSNNNNNNGSSGGGGNSSGSSSASNSNRNSNSSTDCGNNSSNNNNNNNNSNSSGSSSLPNGTGGTTTHCNGVGGVLGLFRSRKHHPAATLGSSGRRQAAPAFNSCSLDGGPLGEPVVLPPMYDDRGMMTLPPPAYAHTLTTTTGTTGTGGHHHHHPLHHHPHHHHLNSVNNNSLGNQHNHRSNYYSMIDDDGGAASEPLDPVERRNRINAQLSASAGGVSTIFRNGHRTAGTTVGAPIGGYGSGRSRTNPRRHGRNGNNGSQQQQPLAVISAPQDPSQYIYHEPVFHEGLIYDGCLSHTYSDRSGGSGSTGTGSTGGGVAYHHPYILPQFTTFRNGGGGGGVGGSVVGVPPSSHPAGTNGGHSIYSRDSSFGSDSGYSQHTQTSNRSVAGWSHRRPAGGQSGTGTVVNPKVAATATDQQQQQQQPPQSTMVVDS
ncbi:probable serine/threonine-protein kinase DDB_G0282963 isoform X1 [Anopheles merus]|uniref:probable serine/threonine-protein kinase DDB_G0282963 isoform X1 n=2 Tax=Anopheles merus TaxID=30066 RepID=UPI001BE4D8F5|nr:probable serine/threonine-protein kinase DDB_G0282963 isoform X1 [Anopheles merus]XP_041786332.1 probable serine/threonine-protein kinase DDB_G0282963 isoform X1 [Anopheles merus]XP_041786337.1 probable serine/threonine-protein kinase DDB_G0282963 isoform X1 [Anopheles merus]XP_041786344.1 probable serine/threonine-protein kinase DDB_G0282963 isoform X1 [Anopheles merus]XP_041786355.1 probable serine/threonine-protein kinase DDB_G0282963 isoform X1 [Anopheles merus]